MVGFILAFVASIPWSAQPLWFWISTKPASVEEDDFAARFRVFRWGEYANRRHGPFVAHWGSQRLSGQYSHGAPVGIWRVREETSGLVHTEAIAIGVLREEEKSQAVELLSHRIRVTHYASFAFEFTVEGTEFTFSPNSSWLGARQGAEGCWISGGLWFYTRGFYPDSEGILLRPDGSLAQIVSGAMRTDFDEQSLIVRQAVVDGEHSSEIDGPPWVHPVSGAMDWDVLRPQMKDSVR